MHFSISRISRLAVLTLFLVPVASIPAMSLSGYPGEGKVGSPEGNPYNSALHDTNAAPEELPDAPGVPAPARVSGTVEDTNGDLVPGATVILRGPTAASTQSAVADANAMFLFENVDPTLSYSIEIQAKEFVDWKGPSFKIDPGQLYLQSDIHMRIQADAQSVTVYGDNEVIATEQVHVEMQQRVLGVIPNFYVSYDPNPVPLSAKLKFKLAIRVSLDPVTLGGSAFIAGIYQGLRYPDYRLGTIGYFQRFGSEAATETSDILFGGAIFPVLFHQDPRYFYQGTGTTWSRMRHAMANPFLCRGDNGKTEINYSTIGGDLASGFLTETYYPASNRSTGLVMENFGIGTGERIASSLLQEFLLGYLTSHSRKKN